MISKIVGFQDMDVAELLKKEFNVHISSEKISKIFRANEVKYSSYRRELLSAKRTLPRRITKYAKANNIKISLNKADGVNNADIELISFAVSKILSVASMKSTDLEDILLDNFLQLKRDRAKIIIKKLRVDGYSKSEDGFDKIGFSKKMNETDPFFIEGIGKVHIIESDRTYFNKRTNTLCLAHGVAPEVYLTHLLKNIYLNENALIPFINKIDSLV